MSVQLRPGYKRTDAGLIPVDWSPHTIGDLVDFEGGSQPDKSVFRQSWKAGYVRLIQIRDYKTDKYETYIPWSLARRFCNESDIMIGRYGPPVFQILRGIDGAYNVALIKAKPCTAINNSYAYYFLKQEKLFAFIEKLSRRSSGQTGVDLKELRQYPLPLPSIDEQETIAEALSDTDSLIESLEQLIAKKRHLKQGTMQELLTGKKRLPGFSGEWEVKKLGDIARVFSGGTPPTAVAAFYGGDIPWITSGDLNKSTITDVEGRITRLGLENSSAKMIAANTLLIALYGATSGISAISKIQAAINQAVLAIVPEVDDSIFLFFQLSYLKDWIISIYTQGGQPNLSGDIVKAIELKLPVLEEQKVIASTLSDMDAEIAELETQLAKTRTLKQGMMHQLLTGEIRLL